MPITSQVTIPDKSNAGGKVKRVFSTATHPTLLDRQKVKQSLAELIEQGRITNRDEQLFEYLRELNVLSLDQIRRLLWSQAKETTAYNRLYFLSRQYLLSQARVPAAGMREWGLPVRNVYTLGLGGWLWLRQEVNQSLVSRQLRREQVLHDLLNAEVYVRLVEATRSRGEAWSVTWAGEEAASCYASSRDRTPLLVPDSLAVIRQQRGRQVAVLPCFIELDKGREAHGRPSSDWGRKVHGYDRLADSEWRLHPQLGNLPEFPLVAVITHGAQRLLNLAQAIIKHRKEAVTYCLALWSDLMDREEDILAAPAWLSITPEGKVFGREPEQREPLITVAGRKR
jgi:hypothetical protein